MSVPPNFFDRMTQGLFPVDSAASEGVPPDQLSAVRRNAMLQLGLGMMAARDQGAGFGSAAFAGLGQAQHSVQGAMQTAFLNAQRKRAQELEKASLDRQDRQDTHQLEREKTNDARLAQDHADQLAQWDRQAKLREEEMSSTEKYHNAGLGMERARLDAEVGGLGKVPQGFRWNSDHTQLEFIPGGPADPTVAAGNRTLKPIPQAVATGIATNRAQLSKIDNALQSVSDNPKAFGAWNYLPDALTQRMDGKEFSGGLGPRAQVADIGSLVLHDRSGAAVTASEYPRLAPFIPKSTDDPKTVKVKLQQLRSNVAQMLDETESLYTTEQGYRPMAPAPPAMLARPQPGGVPPAVTQRVQSYYGQ